ncbi:MAG: DMT family transporter [Hyphomicrobiales bacterium]
MNGNHNIKGFTYAFVSSIGFGIMPIFVKDALDQGVDVFNILLLRVLIASIVLYAFIKIKKLSLKISKRQLLDVIMLGFIGYFMTTFLLFISYTYISIGLATTLHFTYAAFVSLIMVIIFKEKFSTQKIIAVVLSLLGVCVLVLDSHIHINFLGAFLALVTGLTYAIYMVGIAKSKANTLNSIVFIFYVLLVSSVLLLIHGLISDKIVIPSSTRSIIDIFGLTFLSTLMACILLFKAVKIIGASSAAILSTLEPLVSICAGSLLLGEELHMSIIIGALMIITSVILVSIQKKQKYMK